MACQGIGPAGTGRVMSQVPVRAVKLKSQGSKMATVEPQASTSWSDSLPFQRGQLLSTWSLWAFVCLKQRPSVRGGKKKTHMFKESNYAVNWGRQFIWVTFPTPVSGWVAFV